MCLFRTYRVEYPLKILNFDILLKLLLSIGLTVGVSE